MPETMMLRQSNSEQIKEARRRHAPHWGKPLEVSQYLDREEMLARQPYSAGQTHWALVDATQPDTTDFASSCETYERRVLLAEAPDRMQEGKAFGICSVWTRPQDRGKGHAAVMMTLLHQKLQERGAMASFLYSDIDHYYSRVGWTVQGHSDIYCNLSDLPTSTVDCIAVRDDLSQLAELTRQDSQLMAEDLAQAPSYPALSVLLDGRELSWFFARSKFYAAAPNVPLPPGNVEPAIFGAQIPGKKLVYAAWWYKLQDSKIEFLRLRCDTPEELVILLAAARRAGEQYGVEHFLAFDIPDRLLGGLSAFRRQMPDSWPALAVYSGVEATLWLNNEKHAWC